MSILPDYAHQGIELMRQLEGQADLTAQYWSDGKRKEYYTQYIVEYLQWLETFIYGTGPGILRGKCLNDLLKFVSEKVSEFEEAADFSITGDIIANGVSFGANSGHQIFAPADAPESEIRAIDGTAFSAVPSEMEPEKMTKRREDFTVDYKLNSPGNFSAENLRNILNKHRNE